VCHFVIAGSVGASHPAAARTTAAITATTARWIGQRILHVLIGGLDCPASSQRQQAESRQDQTRIMAFIRSLLAGMSIRQTRRGSGNSCGIGDGVGYRLRLGICVTFASQDIWRALRCPTHLPS
jgi:hypothetical protein